MFCLKNIIFALSVMFTSNSFATVDAFTEAWIVVEDFNSEGKFFPQKVPVIGCYGLPQGPQLAQFVSEYKVKSTMGCGDDSDEMTDINALSCATITDSVEDELFNSYKKIVLDISKCPAKNNKNFITMVRTAAARNFPQYKNGKVVSQPEVELILNK